MNTTPQQRGCALFTTLLNSHCDNTDTSIHDTADPFARLPQHFFISSTSAYRCTFTSLS
jgi:hypothetical protein